MTEKPWRPNDYCPPELYVVEQEPTQDRIQRWHDWILVAIFCVPLAILGYIAVANMVEGFRR